MSSPRVVLVGGTGFTGGLVARELLARGLPFCLTGRDPGKVRRAARALREEGEGTAGSGDGAGPGLWPETAMVDVAEPGGLDVLSDLLSPGDVVANCAGPFTDLGDPVIRAAVEAGAHYLDTTGEQRFMMETARRWDGPARERGVAVANAMAFEYAPGDAACALAAGRVGEPEGPEESKGPEELEEPRGPAGTGISLDVTYAWRGPAGGTSPGTRASILRVLARPGLVYEAGEWREERLGARRREVQLEGGTTTTVSFPAGEIVTAGRDPAVDRVRGWLAAGRPLAVGTRLLGPVLPPVVQALAPLLEPVLRRLGPEEPGAEAREASRFLVRAEARGPGGGGAAVEVVRGRDPYGLTARLVVEGARALLERGGTGEGAEPAPAGVLRPSELLAPRRILEQVG